MWWSWKDLIIYVCYCDAILTEHLGSLVTDLYVNIYTVITFHFFSCPSSYHLHGWKHGFSARSSDLVQTALIIFYLSPCDVCCSPLVELDSYLLGKRSFVGRSSPGGSIIFPCPDYFVGLFSVVQLLELYSTYFGRYCRNWLSFTVLKIYPWHLKMVYCKLDILLKMVSCKVMTIENDDDRKWAF